MNEYSYRPEPRRNPWPLIAVGAATFVIGAGGAFAFANWQASQKAALASLELRLEQMQDEMAEQEELLASRNATPDLTAVAAVAALEEPAPLLSEEEQAALLVDPSIQNRQHLEDRIAAARALAGRIKLERLSEGEVIALLQQEVLEGNYSVQAQSIGEDTIGVSLQSANHANTAGLLADILATSANNGDIEVPDYIAVSETGEVDSGTLLFDLVQRSLADGTAEEAAAAEQLSQRTIAAFQNVAANAQTGLNATSEVEPTPAVVTTTATGDQYYTVESGDNLAYIALQFYGRTDAFEVIYAANRGILSDPNRIQVGQRLLIPDV